MGARGGGKVNQKYQIPITTKLANTACQQKYIIGQGAGSVNFIGVEKCLLSRINFGESERIFVKHNKCYGQSLVVVGELGIGAQQQAERQLIVPNPDLLATAQVHFYIYSFVQENPDPGIPGMARRIPRLLRTD